HRRRRHPARPSGHLVAPRSVRADARSADRRPEVARPALRHDRSASDVPRGEPRAHGHDDARTGAMIAASFDPLARLQQWLFEAWVQPLLFSAGWMHYEEQAYDALEWLPVGVLEVLLVALV